MYYHFIGYDVVLSKYWGTTWCTSTYVWVNCILFNIRVSRPNNFSLTTECIFSLEGYIWCPILSFLYGGVYHGVLPGYNVLYVFHKTVKNVYLWWVAFSVYYVSTNLFEGNINKVGWCFSIQVASCDSRIPDLIVPEIFNFFYRYCNLI